MDGSVAIQDRPASVTPAEPDPAASGSAPAVAPSAAASAPPESSPPESAPPGAAPAAPSASAPPDPEKKAPYPPPAGLPTQLGPEGIRFDFNHGARVILPNRTEGKWRVRLRDLDTGNILFQSENQGAFVSSAKRFYVRFSVEVWSLDADGAATSVLSHDYDARGQDILIQFPIGTLGDILAWFPYAPRFAETHGCRLICSMSDLLIPLLRDAYPAIPAGYFDTETEAKLASFEKRARSERRPALSAELPERTLRQDLAAGVAATAIFRNWLGYLAGGAKAALPRTERGTSR